MKILEMDIRNFRSVDALNIKCGDITPICGANSAGKSNILRALRFAFLSEYDANKVARNFSTFVNGPSALIRLCITFDSPSPSVAAVLKVSQNSKFTYEIALKRNGAVTFRINGKVVKKEDRDAFIEEILIVYVPPIRDIAYDGLAPFKEMLARALRKAKKGKSFHSLNNTVRDAIETKGLEVLSKSSGNPIISSAIGTLSVDSYSLDVESLLVSASVQVDIGSAKVPLEMIGTGHQSQVVMGLFRQIGASSSGTKIYIFEEPDNHLHPTALRAITVDLQSLATSPDSQVFLSSHSPILLNQFDLKSIRGVRISAGKTLLQKSVLTKTDRQVRVLLGQFGIRPVEALLAHKVILVEGPSDVTLVRALFRIWFDSDPDKLDVLVIQCGGKPSLVELAKLLKELGANFISILDYDAGLKDNIPYFDLPNGTATAGFIAAIDMILPKMNMPTHKKPKAIKTLESMRAELVAGPPVSGTYHGSPLEALVKVSGKLSASQISQVASGVMACKPSKWIDHLWDAGIWLWSADPEDLMVASPITCSIVENELRVAGLIASSIPLGSVAANVLAGKLHDLAYEPQLLEKIVTSVVSTPAPGTSQFSRLRKKLAYDLAII